MPDIITMKRITVFIEGSSKEITLEESIVISHSAHLYVKKVYVFWEYKNVDASLTALTNNTTVINMYEGYYTFDLIKKLFNNGATLEATKHDGKCKIGTDASTTINITDKLAKLLGFEFNRVFNPNTVSPSSNIVDINLGLKYIKIHCSIVDTSSNLDEAGKKDDTIVSLPIFNHPVFVGLCY